MRISPSTAREPAAVGAEEPRRCASGSRGGPPGRPGASGGSSKPRWNATRHPAKVENAATLAPCVGMRVCVFCGASSGRSPAYADAARAFGTAAAARGLGIVYGGGRVGLMGAVADAALAAGRRGGRRDPAGARRARARARRPDGAARCRLAPRAEGADGRARRRRSSRYPAASGRSTSCSSS